MLHTVHASCHAISLDDGRTRKDAPGSGRDTCKDMDAIQTPHSNLVDFFRTSRNGRRTSCGRQVLVDEYKPTADIRIHMQNKLQHYELYKQLDQFELAAMVRS